MICHARKKKGFTFVELMVVIGIIALCAAIAIPQAMRSRVNSNNAGAIANLKKVQVAMTLYLHAKDVYASSVFDLTHMIPKGEEYMMETFQHPVQLISEDFADGEVAGYYFVVATADAYQYKVYVYPTQYAVTGDKFYVADPSEAKEISKADFQSAVSTYGITLPDGYVLPP